MARILLIGDSHAQGLTSPLRAALAQSGHTLIVDAQQNTKTSDWIGRASSDIASNQPDIILVALGANDLCSGMRPVQSASNARMVVQSAGGRRVIWIGSPNYPTDRGTINAIRGVVPDYIDCPFTLSCGAGAHPNASGYQQWAQIIASRVGSGANFINSPITGGDSSIKLVLAFIFIVLITR